MLLLGDAIWEGKSTEPRPTPEEGAKDGHFLKEVDTGETYHRVDGVWEFVNLGFSQIKATKSGRITTNAHGIYNVTFNTPFINNLYTVSLSCEETGNNPATAAFSNIATTGFTITTRKTKNGQIKGNTVVSWLGTRDYNP